MFAHALGDSCLVEKSLERSPRLRWTLGMSNDGGLPPCLTATCTNYDDDDDDDDYRMR